MYYNRNAQGKSLQAHFIMPFLTEKAKAEVTSTQSGGYINPTKLESGSRCLLYTSDAADED